MLTLAAAVLFTLPVDAASGVATVIPATQFPGNRPPAPPPPPPPPDPAKVAEEARKAAERAAEEARKAAEKAANTAKEIAGGNPRPVVPPLPAPPHRKRNGLGRNDCALVVVSAELADKGPKDIKLLYDFAEGAGAHLPGAAVKDRYAEIVVLDKGNAKLNRFFDELDRLTKKYRAVDAIVHCHGMPFELLWDDCTFDVYDAACHADDALRATFGNGAMSCGMQIALQTSNGRFLSAKDGGGGELTNHAEKARYEERFRVLDLNGGTLQDGDQVQIATVDGHFLCAQNGGGTTLRTDRDSAAHWETFRFGLTGTFGPGARVTLRTQSGHYLGTRGAPSASAQACGDHEKFTVAVFTNTTQRPNVRVLNADQRSRLRYVYETACYGASHAPGWRKLGFDAAAGARGVHCDSACSFPTFLAWWNGGNTFAECVDAANRADRLHAWDEWARKKGFGDVNSQRLVRGQGNLDYASTPVQ